MCIYGYIYIYIYIYKPSTHGRCGGVASDTKRLQLQLEDGSNGTGLLSRSREAESERYTCIYIHVHRSLGLSDLPKVDTLGSWYKFVNFWAQMDLESPKWLQLQLEDGSNGTGLLSVSREGASVCVRERERERESEKIKERERARKRERETSRPHHLSQTARPPPFSQQVFVLHACLEADGAGPLEGGGGVEGGGGARSPFTHIPNYTVLTIVHRARLFLRKLEDGSNGTGPALPDFPKVDTLGAWYKCVNLWAETNPESLKRQGRIE